MPYQLVPIFYQLAFSTFVFSWHYISYPDLLGEIKILNAILFCLEIYFGILKISNIHNAEFSIALLTILRATNNLSFYLIQLFIDNRIIHIYRRDCFEVSRRLPYVFWILQYAEPPAPLGSRPMHMYYLFRLNMTFEYIDNIWLYVVLSLHLLLR